MTIAEALKRAAKLQSVSDSARLDTEILLAQALGKDRTYLYTWPERELTPNQALAFDELISQREQGVPIAYLTGVQEFWSLPLATGRQTLIPRPETELLVEVALDLPLPGRAQVLDLGTGTGAIALALASERAQWQVTALDQVAEAVALAIDNARTLGLDITVLRSHWYDGLAEDQRFDLIVSNPPYIDATDEHLKRGDVRFEPASALVAGNGGLADIDCIIEGAAARLYSGGWLLIEHGWQQAEWVRQRFTQRGFRGVESRRDLAGIERMTLGCWHGE